MYIDADYQCLGRPDEVWSKSEHSKTVRVGPAKAGQRQFGLRFAPQFWVWGCAF